MSMRRQFNNAYFQLSQYEETGHAYYLYICVTFIIFTLYNMHNEQKSLYYECKITPKRVLEKLETKISILLYDYIASQKNEF